MNLLLERVIDQGFILDLFGVLGLGLLAFAALRLARRMDSVRASLMTIGALAMLVGRVSKMLIGEMVTMYEWATMSEASLIMCRDVPTALLTFGLATFVYGFWSHERDTAPQAQLG